MLYGYNGVIRPEDLLKQMGIFIDQTGLRCSLFVYGVGDHGGGPARRDIVRGLDMDTWPVFPNIKFSTATRSTSGSSARARTCPCWTAS